MIKFIVPGSLGLQLPQPEGLPDVDTGRVRMMAMELGDATEQARGGYASCSVAYHVTIAGVKL